MLDTADDDALPMLRDECRTSEWAVGSARQDLDGNAIHLSVYGADAFRFGQLRTTSEQRELMLRGL